MNLSFFERNNCRKSSVGISLPVILLLTLTQIISVKRAESSVGGEQNSVVHGILSQNGNFGGYIFSNGTDYYLEASHWYSSIAIKSHKVSYRTEDMKWHSATMKNDNYIFLNHDSYNFSKNFRKVEFKEKFLPKTRSRRSATERKRQVCTLFIQADYSFYKHFGSESACIDVIAQHVQKANEIYLSTDIDSDGKPGDISFMIKRIKVETQEPISPKLNFSIQGTTQRLLEFSINRDYSSFCLAYLFTMEDLGSLGGQACQAGICAEHKSQKYEGIAYNSTFNIGIVTLFAKNNITKPPTLSHLIFAHELAHSLGSPHDPNNDKMCSPGGEDGNYLLDAEIKYGDKKNNKIISPCTINSIRLYLKRAREKPGCLTEMEDQQGICGNGVVEEDEECDCGWEEDCKESCCFPMKLTHSESEIPCKLKPQAACSPSQGICCGENCTLSFGTMCQDVNKCIQEAVCDGKSPICPSIGNKPDGSICGESAFCLSGECYGIVHICDKFGLEMCICQSESEEMSSSHCEICCKMPGVNSSCISSFKWNESPFNVPDMYAEPGFPCRGYKGTCDPQHICRVKSSFLVLQEVFTENKLISTILIVLFLLWLIVKLRKEIVSCNK